MQVTDPTATAAVVLHKYWLWTKRSVLLIASLFSVVSVAQAGTNTWTSIGPDGGLVIDLAFHPTDPATMYAATSGGFYRSTDSAASWQRTSASGSSTYFGPTDLAVGAGGPDRVHIASSFGNAFRSEDRGVTLRGTNGQITPGSPTQGPSSFAIAAAADGSAIYYAVDQGVYRSTDGGNTRQLRGTVPGASAVIISTLRVDPSNAQTVYATTYGGGVFRSTDAGGNWTVIFTPADVSSDGVWTMALDPQNANRIWVATNASVRVTDDAGVTWRPVLSGTASDLDVDPRNSQIAYAAMLDGSVKRTTDGATTWTSLPVPQRSPASSPSRFAIHPVDSARLYLFGGGGLFVSTDTGATWVTAHAGIVATSTGGFSATPTASGHIFFPIAEYGIGSLRPGADSVELPLNPTFPAAAGSQPNEVSAVLSLPTALIASFHNSRIAFASNASGTWTPAAAPPPSPARSLAAALNGSWTLYAATNSGIYQSNDLGNHWSPTGNGLPADAPAYAIAVAANQTTVYALLSSETPNRTLVYRSVDGGQSWSATSTLLPSGGLLTPHPTDSQTLLAGTDEGVFKTTDGGASWQQLRLSPPYTESPIRALAIDPVNPDIIYAERTWSVANVVRSVDGGATFQQIMPDYYEGAAAVSLIVDPDRSNRVLAAIPGGGIREMSIEPDLELTAVSPSSSAQPSSPVEFTITATNRGPFDATGVGVQVRLPTGTSVSSATNNGNACAIASNIVTCAVGILRNNQAAMIRVGTTTPTTEGSFAVNADVTGAQPDNITANNSASASVSVSSRPPTPTNSGGGGGSFDAFFAIALLSIGLWRRRPKFIRDRVNDEHRQLEARPA